MKKSRDLDFKAAAKGKKFNFENFKIKRCNCGKFPDYAIVVYYIKEWGKVNFDVFFYCKNCLCIKLAEVNI